MAELRLATRGSALALAQSEMVAESLRDRGHEVELIVAESATESRPGAPGGDKARFVRSVQEAVLSGRADAGVHSAKDLPYEVPDRLVLAAVPAREDPRDAWIGAVGGMPGGGSIEEVPPGARVGTASLRRRSQLLALRPDLEVIELRGNVDTRIGRLRDGDYDAIVLATAGLRRLHRESEITFSIAETELLPAAGQGALAIEARADDPGTLAALAEIDDSGSQCELICERALIGALEADCDSPVGARCARVGEGLLIEAYVGTVDGADYVRDRLQGPGSAPEQLGAECGDRLLAAGAGAILGRE